MRTTSRGLVIALLLSPVTSLALAGCGSRLDPDTVAAADPARGGGTAVTTGDDGDATGPVADGTGTGPVGADPGADTSGVQPPVGTSDGSAGDGPGSDSGDGEDPPATGDGPKGNCQGFTNGVGITDSTITIGNAADVSGPIPGVFEASQDAVRAFVAYFNATSDICGRKLVVKAYDSRTDGAANQQAYVAGCSEVFAMIGSMSAFDASGATETATCGLPDLRAASITTERIVCPTCFGALSSNPNEFQNAVPDFVVKEFPDAAEHAAMFYINVGAAPDNAKNQAAIFAQRGMRFDLVQGIDISEFNYAPYVQQMKDQGIRSVHMIGGSSNMVRMAQAMQQQSFTPDLFLIDPTVYNPEYVASGGSAAEGTTTFLSIVPFEESSSTQELQLYTDWLHQVKPSATPDFFGVYAWSAARLFVEQAAALGGSLDRASFVAALKKVDDWTDHGLHSPQHVGTKHVGECNRFMRLEGGHWRPIGGTKYTCHGVSTLD
jgi:ABC-type branched-subunit amino acid transport system substrate-binding protein